MRRGPSPADFQAKKLGTKGKEGKEIKRERKSERSQSKETKVENVLEWSARGRWESGETLVEPVLICRAPSRNHLRASLISALRGWRPEDLLEAPRAIVGNSEQNLKTNLNQNPVVKSFGCKARHCNSNIQFRFCWQIFTCMQWRFREAHKEDSYKGVRLWWWHLMPIVIAFL